MKYKSGEDPQIGDTVESVVTGIKYTLTEIDPKTPRWVCIQLDIDHAPFGFSVDDLNLVERKPPVHGFKVGDEFPLADHHTADDIGTAAQEETWIAEAQRIINGNRADDYGTAGTEDTASAIAAAWSAYLGHTVTPEDFCWLMVLLKAIRDKHKAKRDNKVDAHGYLLLMEKHAASPEETR